MLRLGNANAIVIQGLIAPKGLDCLKALISWEFENKPEMGGGYGRWKKTLVLRAPLVAIGAQKCIFEINLQNHQSRKNIMIFGSVCY